jgi:hypothetical protein
MNPAPIALFAYNRPVHLQRTIAALQRSALAKESELWMFCDASKKPVHEGEVRKVREIAHAVGGFRAVEVVERTSNLGLARSIEDGVGRLCADYGRAIVVEDDIVVAPGFLDFLNRALDRYAEVSRVMQISGYMFPGDYADRGDAVFLPLISCWGWATWKRAWDRYDPTGAGAAALRQDAAMRRRFNLDGAYDYYGMLERQLAGALDSWGVRWLLSVFLADGVVLYPSASLVENIGADGTGTHGVGSRGLHSTPSGTATVAGAIRFPAAAEVDAVALERVRALLRAEQPGLIRRVIDRLWQPAI